MKKATITLFIILFAQLLPAQGITGSYDQLWENVFQLEMEALTQSALKAVQTIQAKAQKEGNTQQEIKALLFTSKYILMLEEDAKLKVVTQFKEKIATTTAPEKNLLESYLANLYWQYFQQNRYRFYNRTALAEPVDSVDFRTWDTTTLFNEITRHFQYSLEQPSLLQKTPIEAYSILLYEQPGSDRYRPTLFDLLAHTALDFFKTDENSITQPADKFEIDDPELLCDAYVFAHLTLATSDRTSLQAQALQIYQQLVAFHFETPKLDALVAIDIDRLKFIYENAIFEQKDQRYMDVLTHAEQLLRAHETSTLYTFERAKLLQQQGNQFSVGTGADNKNDRWKLKEAVTLCDQAMALFPGSLGAQKCEALKSQILAPSLALTAERYISTQTLSRLLVNYKNKDAIYLRVLKISQKEWETLNSTYPESKQLDFLKSLKASTTWKAELKNEGDHQTHGMEIPLPPLANGQYIILASSTKEMSKVDIDLFAFTKIQATDVALNERNTTNKKVYQVFDRNNGQPISNAKVNLYYTRNHMDSLLTKTLVTNAQGVAELLLQKDGFSAQNIKVEANGETAFFGNSYINPKQRPTKDRISYKTFLFHDRAIYRPGQPIYFKGICVERDGDKSILATEELVTVSLFDANDQKVQEMDVQTNAYGSFSGEFILPERGLNGQFHLEVYGASGIIHDYFFFAVEEYKRPNFQVSFLPITQTYKVNDSVTMKGMAQAFAGSSISHGKVVYRVLRRVNYPPWFGRHRPFHIVGPQEIAFGETQTDHNGGFSFPFLAIPDKSSNLKDQPIFSYEVSAEITDINGETHSALTTVNVGYHAMTAKINVSPQLNKAQKEHTITLQTQNLNGQDVAATGTLKMYKLQAPDRVLRQRPWPAPDYRQWDRATFIKMYPHEAYDQEQDQNTWAKAEKVWEQPFNTGQNTTLTLKNTKKWPTGQYVLVLETTDAFGQPVTAEAHTQLYDATSKTLADQQLFAVRTNKADYQIGDTARVTFYTNVKDLYLTYWVEKKKEIQKIGMLHLTEGHAAITIPVTKEDIGGFAVNYSFSAFDDYRSGTVAMAVPYPSTELQITASTFRDKIEPGTDETWGFAIKGPQGERVAAELLASMYDASLDQFVGHQWYFNPLNRNYYYPISQASANLSYGTEYFRVYNQYMAMPNIPEQQFDRLEWFGLHLGNVPNAQRTYLRRWGNRMKTKVSTDNSVPKGYVKGIVYDITGEPLTGVNVLVKGTTQGTVTDFDGHFMIQATSGDTLVFSYLGYTSLAQPLNEGNVLSIFMQEDSSALEEVVITGYGNQKQRSLTGALSEDSSAPREAEMDIPFQGKVAGMTGEKDPVLEQATMTLPLPLDGIPTRKNLQETAFFFPHLETDAEGTVRFSFKTPEALTRWNLQLLAHTKTLKHAAQTYSTVTQKELMVLPNLPRFLREGDTITLISKIANLSDQPLSGQAQLELTHAITGAVRNDVLKNTPKSQLFHVDANGNTTVSWQLVVPEDLPAVQYKILAKTATFSDGQQDILPVLSNRMLVTETLPMWVGSGEKKSFTLEKLKNNPTSTGKNHKLTLEVTSNPIWYAIQALPFLMEYPYECSEQTFARYYANALASHIATSSPKVKQVFEQWRNSDALLSNLEKNQELKAMLIEETPWLRDAQSETDQKKRIALLFDMNKMRNEQTRTLQKLKDNQLPSGGWPWFKGGRENRSITQHILMGMGELHKLIGTNNENTKTSLSLISTKALDYLDKAFIEEYKSMKARTDNLQKDHLSTAQVHYLYLRSFFTHIPLPEGAKEIQKYYLDQAGRFWTHQDLYTKGLLALVLARENDTETAQKIVRSLKENSVVSEQLGMYWKENTHSWLWYKDPIATQALLIAAFTEIEGATKTVDQLKIWLLKNKQTNQWGTTKATTQAIYALLLQGSDWASLTETVGVNVGGAPVLPKIPENLAVEAGTGYFKTSWNGAEVTPKMATVDLEKKGAGVAWGTLYWQYFENLDQITKAETPLALQKILFLKRNTETGEQLTEITNTTPVQVGDLVRIRIVLRADRPMDFLHMKDMRAAGLEPTTVLSTYQWQDGLGYYQSTKDAATHFFFDYLPKGVYVFEYDLRVNHAGNFSNGITTIQSMYAPEFSSHSDGIRVQIGR
jgi:uncharacterized protein YfaS (alpha-2-macroglobulin family)